MGKRLTLEEYTARVTQIHPHIKVLARAYFGTTTKHKHGCLICEHKWLATPNALLIARNGQQLKYGCPKCGQRARSEIMRMTRVQIDARIAKVHGPNVRLLGQYRGSDIRHRFKCYTCLGTWKACPKDVYHKASGCPYCNNKVKWRRAVKARFAIKTLTIQGVEFHVQGYEPQAIAWLLEYRKVQVSDIKVDSSGEVPVIPYKMGRRKRNFYPDIFIKKLNRIVEVKSPYTLGLLTGKQWRQNQEKAKAVLAAGYKFSLFLLSDKGTRYWLPPDWYSKSRKQVLIECVFNQADISPFEQIQYQSAWTKEDADEIKRQRTKSAPSDKKR